MTISKINTAGIDSNLSLSGNTSLESLTVSGIRVGKSPGSETNYISTVLGKDALSSETTGSDNVAVGRRALKNSTTSFYNIGIGTDCLFTNTTGFQNVGVGAEALYYNETGINNTAVGTVALCRNTIGRDNTALGFEPMAFNTTGEYNVALGSEALLKSTTGNNNTSCGTQSLYYSLTGNNNTAVGYRSGYNITSGANNTILGCFDGNQNGLDITTSNNYIVLSDGVGNPRIVVNDSGNVGIGTSSPGAKLDVVNAAGRAARIGGFQFAGTTTTVDGGNNLLSSGVYWNGSNLTATQTTGAVIQLGNGAIQFQALSGLTAGNNYSFAPQLSFDSSGNLGLGVTPSPLTGGGRSIEVGYVGNIVYGRSASLMYVGQNVIYNSGWTRAATGYASLYEQSSGVHNWYNAGNTSGAIVWTNAMTLDASGNLGLGVTPSASYLTLPSAIQMGQISVLSQDINSFYINANASAPAGKYLRTGSYAVSYHLDASAGSHKWFLAGVGTAGNYISPTQAMTLDASGILSANDIRSPIFYDSNDTSYYINPNGSSVFYRLYVAGYGVRSSQALDLRSLDQSTYYPVTITGLAYARSTRLRVFQQLDGNSVPSWSTHPGGFSLRCDWVVNGYGWGTIAVERTINNFTYNFANVNPVGGISQMGNSSYEVIYLRGGGYYYFESDADASAIIRTSSFTSDGQTVAPTTSVVNDVWTSASNKFGIYSLYSGSLGTGAVYSNVGVLTSTNPSDQRLKDDISSVNWGLNELMQFSPKSFVWKEDRANQGKQYGWIAQEVKEVIPELVKPFDTDEGVRYGLDKDGIIIAMHNAIKELSTEIELLKQKLNNL